MLSISQNTHIKNIISEQGDPTPDPRFLELQYFFVMDLRIMGDQLESRVLTLTYFILRAASETWIIQQAYPGSYMFQHDQPYTIYCI